MQQTRSSQHVHLIRRAACDIVADPKTPSHLSQVTPWIAPPLTSERASIICRGRFGMTYAISSYIRYIRKFPTSGPWHQQSCLL